MDRRQTAVASLLTARAAPSGLIGRVTRLHGRNRYARSRQTVGKRGDLRGRRPRALRVSSCLSTKTRTHASENHRQIARLLSPCTF